MPDSMRDRLKAGGRAVSGLVRRARNRLQGWRKWALVVFQATVGLVVLFAATNLTLSLTTFRGEHPVDHLVSEARGLWFSPADGRAVSPTAFDSVFGEDLGPEPSATEIRTYFARKAEGGVFLLDHVMADHIIRHFGQIDGRTLPPGLYVGAHALGPDGDPWVRVTKWPAHYLMFPRHAYLLVIPESGPALAFSASMVAKFDADLPQGGRLGARTTAYGPDSYDFPSSGQALHEMTLISNDPEFVAAAPAALERARAELNASGLRYGLLAPNSNTVVGCILEASGAITRQQRSRILLAARAPGIGADCS